MENIGAAIWYTIPVGFVLACIIGVYVFGFKTAEEPPFEQLTGDDRKPAGKKRKLKDKKSQSNGHATAVGDNEPKSVSTKSSAKDEKSPAKDAPSKTASKQQKKQEASPLKDKPIAKQKDNKTASETPPKQKGKGKENKVEEIKNKKNEKNLAKLLKAEKQPAVADNGGWKEVLSSKDKKSRGKKDEPEEILPRSPIITPKAIAVQKQNNSTPVKAKSIELVLAELGMAIPGLVENKEIVEEKEAEKEEVKIPEVVKKVEKEEKKAKVEEEKGEKEVEEKVNKKKAVVEKIVAVEVKPDVESTPEAAKSKKKNKKKKDEVMDVVEHQLEVPDIVQVAQKKLSESSDKAVDNKKTKAAKAVETVETAVFDELGDTWEEAKVPKKNKKKVRKE